MAAGTGGMLGKAPELRTDVMYIQNAQSDIFRVAEHHRFHRPVKEMDCPQLVMYCRSLRKLSRTQTRGRVQRAADTSADSSVRINLNDR